MRKRKVGDYEPEGNGWNIQLEYGCSYSTKSQDTIEILSRLIRIERMLKKLVEK